MCIGGFGQSLLSEEGCYRDTTTDVDHRVEADPVLKALSFMDESSNQSVNSAYSGSRIANSPEGLLDRMCEDLSVNLRSPDPGYVSGTPLTLEGGFLMDEPQLYSPTVDFSIPPAVADYSGNHMPGPTASGASPTYSAFAFHGQSPACDGMEFPPMPQPPLFEGYNCPIISPKPSIPYPPPQPVKDNKYTQRRVKNNAASKVSREKRRTKTKDLDMRQVQLVTENNMLKTTIEKLESEIAVIREKVVQKLGGVPVL